MLRSSEVIGLQVICLDTGASAGRVKGILLEPGKKLVRALVLDKALGSRGYRTLDISMIKSIGKDAVVIESERCLSKRQNIKKNKDLKTSDELDSARIYTREGEELGFVNDILFDLETASMEGFIISDGIVQDILTGKNMIPLLGEAVFSDEGIFIAREAHEEMINSGKGIKNVLKEE